MTDTLLRTKLYIPPLRPNRVTRPHLTERLDMGLQLGHKLSLISAPAGFGKTTLVSEWIAGCERPAAWLSLDERDNDPTRFLAYLVAALQTIEAKIGTGVSAVLQSSQAPPTESILTVLLNEITTVPDDFMLVLDDYHVIDSQTIDNALTFLLEHLPPQMHLVITTREDPNLPLARLRGRSQLTELRAGDLRFTSNEAAVFLNQVMGLDLSAEDVSSLEVRTEGWIAALQLAALSMRGREDVRGFIRAFAGDHRYIVDYLLEEVLHRQPGNVRNFLLRTSILEHLSGPLCDAVTGQEKSNNVLEALERGNLFVVSLDDRRQWYRYHHLFADVLRARAIEVQPDELPTLHRRASEWYEHNGSPADAIRHALAAEEFQRAAGLIELAWPEMERSFQTGMWLAWAKALPDALVRVRPVLNVGCAWALLNSGEMEAANAYLRNAERWLDTAASMSRRPETSAAEMLVVDEKQFRTLPATIATARAYQAQAHGDAPGTITYGRRALDLLPEGDHLQRGITAALLALAYWAEGDLEAAHRSMADGMANMQLAGNILFAIRGTYILADIRMSQGRLHEAISTYERSLQLAAEQGEFVLRGTADLYLRLSELLLEQDNLSAAAQYVLKSEELGRQAESPIWRYRLCLAQARLKKAQGDLDGALDLLDEAERRYVRTPVPEVHPISALKARVWITQGRLNEAQNWADEQGLSVDDDLGYLREFEHITLARLLMARYASGRTERFLRQAIGLLERLHEAAEAGGRTGDVIEILVLLALAHEAQSNIPLALKPLAQALSLAMPEGYIRIFVDEGRPMARLLTEANALGIMPDYTAKLLDAFEAERAGGTGESPSIAVSTSQPLIEPLSQRELEVLQLITQGLSNREISERLFIALSTVKGHNQNIYSKLQVQRRTEAIARARELGLF